MPIINQNTPVANISVPIPTPVQTQPKQATPTTPTPIQPPKRQRPSHRPLTFGGEHDKFGNRVQGVSAVILPWSPQNKKLSRRGRPKRYAGETTEEDFHRVLDENPDDHHTRMVFADWLQERNDPRAEGYRALGQLQRRPYPSRYYPHNTWLWGHDRNRSNTYDYPNGRLPTSWLKSIKNNHPDFGNSPDNIHWKYATSRRKADDAAASGFTRLPSRIKNLILRRTKHISRKRTILRYARPTLTEPQKIRAKEVELVVLPKGIEGKKCGTCKYAKKHSADSIGLYCTNNAVHMNVKANWGCKLWDAKGVKRLSRKTVVID